MCSMLNQESKDVAYMANITGIKLMLGVFFSVNSSQIALSSGIWDCFTKWYGIHSSWFCFCQGFFGYIMETEEMTPFSAAGLKVLSPAVSIRGITSQAS